MIDLNTSKKFYFIGIGGISMSSIAEILVSQGHTILGSNNVENEMVTKLIEKGFKINIGHNKDNITSDIDYVIYNSAISSDNEELVKANELNIPCIRRDVMFGELMKKYDNPICISGTHGKTTTSSMISEIFMSANLNPTISIGGIIKSINSNTKIGGNEYFINESCEYKNAFLSFYPSSAVILNIDTDHLDFFKNLDDIRKSFKEFAQKIPNNGTLIINNNIADIKDFLSDIDCNIITYGNMTADIQASNITYDVNGIPTFDVMYKGEFLLNATLNVPGYHNVSNALAAIGIAITYNINNEAIKEGLLHFIGAERRLELKGEFNGIKVYDDYAHHPTEITASLASLNVIPHDKLYLVFQPHTYTRTASLLDEFALALSKADRIIIADIYAAREQNTVNISSEDLVEKIKQYNENAIFIKTFAEIEKYLKANCTKGDTIAIMGAGDINKICSNLLK